MMPRKTTRKQRGGRSTTQRSRTRKSGTPSKRLNMEDVQNATLTPREKKLKVLFKKMWAQHVNALLESRALSARERGILRLAREELRRASPSAGAQHRED